MIALIFCCAFGFFTLTLVFLLCFPKFEKLYRHRFKVAFAWSLSFTAYVIASFIDSIQTGILFNSLKLQILSLLLIFLSLLSVVGVFFSYFRYRTQTRRSEQAIIQTGNFPHSDDSADKHEPLKKA